VHPIALSDPSIERQDFARSTFRTFLLRALTADFAGFESVVGEQGDRPSLAAMV